MKKEHLLSQINTARYLVVVHKDSLQNKNDPKDNYVCLTNKGGLDRGTYFFTFRVELERCSVGVLLVRNEVQFRFHVNGLKLVSSDMKKIIRSLENVVLV